MALSRFAAWSSAFSKPTSERWATQGLGGKGHPHPTSSVPLTDLRGGNSRVQKSETYSN